MRKTGFNYRFQVPAKKDTRSPRLRKHMINGVLTLFHRSKWHCVHCGAGHVLKEDTERVAIHICTKCGKSFYFNHDPAMDMNPLVL
jgi:transcription elongation factor Elf1